MTLVRRLIEHGDIAESLPLGRIAQLITPKADA